MSEYLDLSPKLRRAVRRNKFHLVLEMYHSSVDDIFNEPARAMFRYGTINIQWAGCHYKAKLSSMPSWEKFINKQFNSLTVDLMNVKRGSESPGFIVLNQIIKGFRVVVRCIAEGLSIEESHITWSGRLDSMTQLTKDTVSLNCTQEIGKFSYQVATDVYGSACPLRFGFGDCLGNQTLAEKSLLYRQRFAAFGYGGCNHTHEACDAMANLPMNQGQRKVTTGSTFNRPTIVKKPNWWTLGLTKKKKLVQVPVQWSPKNQDDNSSEVIGNIFGRVSRQGRAFTSADIGGQLVALVAFAKAGVYGIETIAQLVSNDTTFPIATFTPHLGTLGGIGTQQPDPRFLESGYNSRLVYAGVTYDDLSDDPLSDSPNEIPTTSGILKGNLVPTFDGHNWIIQWTQNPVWIGRYLAMNFPYTVVKTEWWSESKNLETANRCFRVVEDDTNADIATISNNEVQNFNDGLLFRFQSAGRFNSSYVYDTETQQLVSDLKFVNPDNLRLPFDPSIEPNGDIDFFPIRQVAGNSLQKTFLQLQHTLNLVIGDTESLSDLLYGFVFPSFRGYLSFDKFGKIFIGSRQAAPNAFVRTDWLISENDTNKIPVTNVSKLRNKGGKLLISTGQINGEIRLEQGFSYIHTATSVSSQTVGTTTLQTTNFIDREGAPSFAKIKLGGVPKSGDRISVTFSTPIVASTTPRVLTWDWFVDADTDTLAIVTLMLKTRLEASMPFEEFWTCYINPADSTEIVIEFQGGYLHLNKPLLKDHFAGEEILRVVEVYENFKDTSSADGTKDNIFDFTIAPQGEQYQTVKGTYISAIEDFTEVEILPQNAWANIEDEREMNILELDLRGIDNYKAAADIVKANYIDFVVGGLYGTLETVNLAMFHNEDDVIAVQYQTLEGAVSYLPMSILSLHRNNDSVLLGIKLYLSAMFDRRTTQEEKRLETTLTPFNEVAIPTQINLGGYSSTRTGDGAADAPQDIIFKPKPYLVLPKRYHTDGSSSEVTQVVLDYKPIIFDTSIAKGAEIGYDKLLNHEVGFLPAPINFRITDTEDGFCIVEWD